MMVICAYLVFLYRTEKHSKKSWEDLPPSTLKRKFESWKARNHSGQLSSAFHRDGCECTPSSDNLEVELEQRTSPSKRTRENVLIVSNPRTKKSPKQYKKIRSPNKPSVIVNLARSSSKCPKCNYRKVCASENSGNEDSSTSSVTCICNCKKHRSPRKYSVERDENICVSKKTLEAAQTMLNYSPESVFLRRLKKKSQMVSNLLSPGNMRKSDALPSYAKSAKNISERKGKISSEESSPRDNLGVSDGKVRAGSKAKSPLRNLPHRVTIKSPVRDLPSKALRPNQAKSAVKDCFTKSPQRDKYRKLVTAKSSQFGDVGESSVTTENRGGRKNKKRVCYRKNCYCRVQQRRLKPKRKIDEDVKENICEADSVIRVCLVTIYNSVI